MLFITPQANGGFLADSKDNEEFLKYLLRLTMNVYDETQRVWVYSRGSGSGCSAFERNRVVGEYDCYYIMHPFVCEEGKIQYAILLVLNLYHQTTKFWTRPEIICRQQLKCGYSDDFSF